MIGTDWHLVNTETWTEDAACRGEPPELFFPDPRSCAREAKAICIGCPVRLQCLDYALRTEQRHGVWGALSEIERRRIPRHGAAKADQALKRALEDHGTVAAYRKHYRRRETPCESCRQAELRRHVDWRRAHPGPRSRGATK